LSKGCHALIKQGAKLVESAEDILEEFGCPPGVPGLIPENDEAAREEFLLLKHLSHDITDVDTLCMRSGLTVEIVSTMLLTLELDGIVANLPGGRYQRLR
jgi:DNA processing protein